MTRIISIVGGMQPSTPTIGTATDGGTGTTASVAFTPSTYIGKGTITYTATSSPGGLTATGSSSPITVTGLTTGTAYTFTVVGTTNYGVSSAASAASNSVTPSLPNNYVSIASTYLTSTATTITFSSIPNTYKHLQIRAQIRDTYTNPSPEFTDLAVRFNSDSSSTYYYHYFGVTGSGSLVQNTSTSNAQYFAIYTTYGGNSSAGNFAPTILDIHDYANTTKRKTIMSVGGGVGYNMSNSKLFFGAGHWPSTNAINSITINASTTAFRTGTTVSLYGI